MKLPDFPFSYQHTPSETGTIEYFGGLQQFLGASNRPVDEVRNSEIGSDVFLCFTNRSGSNFLARVLRSTGRFPLAEEVFNRDAIERRASAAGSSDFSQYCRMIRETTAHGGSISAVKTSWHQLYFLYQMQLIPGVFRAPKFIHIQRRDVLGQAISFSLASQTGAWISNAGTTTKKAEFDELGILRFMERITISNARFEALFALLQPKVCKVYYEDLVADPDLVVRDIFETLDLLPDENPASLKVDMNKVGMRKQRNEFNEQFRLRMMEKYKL